MWPPARVSFVGFLKGFFFFGGGGGQVGRKTEVRAIGPCFRNERLHFNVDAGSK